MQPQRSGPFPYVPINRRPRISWPNGARLALWVIPNIETFPLNEPVPGGTGLAPDVINWAPRDYGNRVGIFRMMEVMARHGVRGTVALNAEVCDDYPQIIEDARALGWEFMGHNQSNARLLHLMEPDGGSCSRRFPASKRRRATARKGGSRPACKRAGKRSITSLRPAPPTSPTGSTTTSPI
jgi:hypothetical protein